MFATLKQSACACLMLVAASFMMLSGCATMDRIGENETRIDNLNRRTDSMSTEIDRIGTNIDQLIRDIGMLTSQMEKGASETAAATAQAKNVQTGGDKDIMFIEHELARIEGRLERLERGATPKGALDPKQAPGRKKLSIKVLSGTGNINEARMLAQFLGQNGYTVKRVDFATSKIDRDTIYYSRDHRAYAEDIARLMGSSTVLKPMSWGSVYDIIAVKGK